MDCTATRALTSGGLSTDTCENTRSAIALADAALASDWAGDRASPPESPLVKAAAAELMQEAEETALILAEQDATYRCTSQRRATAVVINIVMDHRSAESESGRP
eukprot:SAG11_NODE_3609_length_2342_cov_1.734730_4_plen_105_part_00